MLDETITSRDYLFGRLLAIAEYTEAYALKNAKNNRSTNAARLFQRFAARPSETWRQIYERIQPYIIQLEKSKSAIGFIINRKKEIGDVIDLFDTGEFTCNNKLTDEYLVGYFHQMQSYRKKPQTQTTTEE